MSFDVIWEPATAFFRFRCSRRVSAVALRSPVSLAFSCLASSALALGCGASEADGVAGSTYEQPPASAQGANAPPAVTPAPSAAPSAATTGTGPVSEAPPTAVPLEPAAPEPVPGAATPDAVVPAAAVSLPGVVVTEAEVSRCAALCQGVLDVAADADGDDWAVENEASCVIPNTLTARSHLGCNTGEPLPVVGPLAGVLVGDGLEAVCRPVCVIMTEPSSLDAPDWSYERDTSCVLPGTPTVTSAARTCSFGGEAPPLLVPPALTRPKVAPGFFIRDGRLLDAYGNDFVIRGVNNPHIWFDVSAQYRAYEALDTIAGYGTNTIRVAWETSGPVGLLREVMYRVVELGMVPMIELHDATSSTSRAELVDMAEYYGRADVKAVLNDFREYALVNIANEWSGNDYFGAYQEAITYLRNNGVDHTLVIDANGFGQNGQVLLDNAAALTNADPRRNLLFSVHMYELFQTPAAVDNLLGAADRAALPLIVGEFGHIHNGRDVAWERILTRTNELGLGYIAWSWFGNDATTAALDMAVGPEGPLTGWGQDVMTRAPGNIQSTSEPASIFE